MDPTRSELRGAAFAFLLPLAGILLCSTVAEAQVLNAEYESGTTDSGISTLRMHGCCSHSHSAASNAHRRGEYSLKSYLKYGDPQVYEGPRAETSGINHTASRFNHLDTFYYGFSIYVLSTLEDDGINVDILYQWKTRPDECDEVDGTHMFLGIKRDDFVLRLSADPHPCSMMDTIVPDEEDLGKIVKGRWNDFVVRVAWSYTASGRITVWRKSNTDNAYVLVLDRLSQANMLNDVSDGFLKWGIYKPSWKAGPTSVTERQFWHDNVRVGTTFEQVDPSLQ